MEANLSGSRYTCATTSCRLMKQLLIVCTQSSEVTTIDSCSNTTQSGKWECFLIFISLVNDLVTIDQLTEKHKLAWVGWRLGAIPMKAGPYVPRYVPLIPFIVRIHLHSASGLVQQLNNHCHSHPDSLLHNHYHVTYCSPGHHENI